MPVDRDAALKKADKQLGHGNLAGAIEEYVRVVEEYPRDWNTINTLGDLYARSGDIDRAVAHYTRVADHLFEEGFFAKAAALYKKALKVRGDYEPALSRLGDIAIQQGHVAEARNYLWQLVEHRRHRRDTDGAADVLVRIAALDTDAEGAAAAALGIFSDIEAANDDPDLLLALARRHGHGGRDDRARAAVTRFIVTSPARAHEVLTITDALAGGGRIDAAYALVELVSDAALMQSNHAGAADALEHFLEQGSHLAALIRLVDVCVEGGLDERLREAQRRLADAYHSDEASGPADGQAPAGAVVEPAPVEAAPGAAAPINPAAPPARPAPRDLDSVFADMRSRAGQDPAAAAASQLFDRAQQLLLEGRASAAIQDLESAARTPALRFRASAQLGRLHVERGDVEAGIDWLERAAEAPAPSEEEGVAVLYDLAGALERMGEQARALAVLLELQAQAAAYRDVRERIDRLSRAQAGHPRA